MWICSLLGTYQLCKIKLISVLNHNKEESDSFEGVKRSLEKFTEYSEFSPCSVNSLGTDRQYLGNYQLLVLFKAATGNFPLTFDNKIGLSEVIFPHLHS